jgi:hypothetical protein
MMVLPFLNKHHAAPRRTLGIFDPEERRVYDRLPLGCYL